MSLSGEIIGIGSSVSIVIGLAFMFWKQKRYNVSIDYNANDNIESYEDFNGDFESNELNSLVKKIKSKSINLQKNKSVIADMSYMFILQKADSSYLEKIHSMYMDVPPKKRGEKGIENSPYNLTYNQLNLIVNILDEIEAKVSKKEVILEDNAILKENSSSM
jgi:hypothetical protein